MTNISSPSIVQSSISTSWRRYGLKKVPRSDLILRAFFVNLSWYDISLLLI